MNNLLKDYFERVKGKKDRYTQIWLMKKKFFFFQIQQSFPENASALKDTTNSVTIE